MTVTLRCFASSISPLVNRVTTLFFQPRNRSRSILGGAKTIPLAPMSAASSMTLAACNRALDGMHPTFKHTPPSTGQRSIKVTCIPKSAARNAAVYPPTPDPSTTRSTAPAGAALTGLEVALGAPAAAGARLGADAVLSGVGASVGDAALGAALGDGALGGGALGGATAALAGAGAGLAAFAAAAASGSTSAIKVPEETSSPFLISIELITPLIGDGTSIAALSDSSEISGSSTATLSPFLTSTSRTETPLTSPRSGTRTSVLITMPSRRRAFLRETPRSAPPRRRR